MQQLPIGVFDSGMGGLTVLRALMQVLPAEQFVYLGDTARLPYGTKSRDTVLQYAVQMSQLLTKHAIKCLVVACNTATTAALPHLQRLYPHIPVIGVVEPGARTAAKAARNQRVVVLATETTIASGIYQQSLAEMNPALEIMTKACGLFVAVAEEGCVRGEVAKAVVRHYCQPWAKAMQPGDCVLLGCTHFPVLKSTLCQLLGEQVLIVDSADATAAAVQQELYRLGLLLSAQTAQDRVRFLVTDLPERFVRVGRHFLGDAIQPHHIQLVDFDDKNVSLSLFPQ